MKPKILMSGAGRKRVPLRYHAVSSRFENLKRDSAMEDAGHIDTRNIKIPEELLQLTERVAANVHHRWVEERLAEGWRPGPRRNDETKETPLLVPYAELSEQEKGYDRITALETVKSILALGFSIIPPNSSGATELTEEMLKGWESSSSIYELLSAHRFVQEKRVTDPRAYRILAHRLLRKGQPLLAYDIASDGLMLAAGDVRLQQLQALALARSGATGSANRMLSALWESGHTDAETSGMLARTHKDLWLMLSDKRKGAEHLLKAHALYKLGYEDACRVGDIDGGIYNGINAASTALMMDEDAAATLSEEVSALCDQRVPPDYWSLASKAEAALVHGDLALAEKLYAVAAGHRDASSGDLSATRGQARLLLKHLKKDPKSFDHCFPVPAIRVIRNALHMTQTEKHFEEAHKHVQAAVPKDGRHFLYMCVFSYPDLALVEAFLDGGHEVHVVLPVSPDGHAIANEQGVAPEKLKAVLGRCASVLVASGYRAESSPVNTQYSELLRDGLALLHAQSLDTELITEDLVDDGQRMRLTAAKIVPMPPGASTSERVRAILFADAVNFSRLSEDQVETFSRDFLGAIAEVIDHSVHKPLLQKTWGDGLCFVFETPAEAGRFALELRDRIIATDWTALGLPNELSLRIALHAGPIFEVMDPITKRRDFTGAHVSRGARIEPKTPPGQVYASENFAAIAAAEKIVAFRCEYVGRLPLAKGYGTFAIYHVKVRDLTE
jgi:class 3 adenylate cyclase